MLNKIRNMYLNNGYTIPLLISFLLPFGVNFALFIIIWALCFFILDDVKKGIQMVIKQKWSFVLITFFLVHVFGIFYASQKSEIFNSIEIKFVFLAFPILFFSSNYNFLQIKKILIAFVTGCVLASFSCLFRAFYLYLFQDTNSFFYSEFSYFVHPSYMAMYLVFAQLIVLLFYPNWLSHLKNLNFKIGFITILFLITIFLCSSKMGLITAFLIIPSTFFVQLYQKGYKKIILISLLSCLCLGVLAFKFFPTPFQRFKTAFQVTTSSQTINKNDSESTAVRILIWKESIQIINNHFWLGTSSADVNHYLLNSYEANGLTGALAKKLNAHNQFLQTFIGTGIIGFLLLLMMTLYCVVYSFIKKNYILALFGILISLNFMVESMLQTQAGFTFFTFFLCLLLNHNFNKKLTN